MGGFERLDGFGCRVYEEIRFFGYSWFRRELIYERRKAVFFRYKRVREFL